MRAVMMACLFATACGTAQLDDEQQVPGDDSSGPDRGGTTFGGSIAFDHRIDAIVDGMRWWVGTTSPSLSGTYSDATLPTVTVTVGNVVSNAVMRPGGWSVDLPAGSIASTDTLVTATLTDANGGKAEATQTFIYDAEPPMIALQPSVVADESHDAVDFSSGQPVHTASSATVDLAGAGCPVVHKYGYLMSASVPYGKRTAPNPLAWHFKLADMSLGMAKPSARVRSSDGAVVLDWKNVPDPDSAGIYTVELTGSGGAFPIAQLGTTSGTFYIDVLATDWSGNQTIKTWCWNNQPLQPPVAVKPFVQGSLFAMSFTNNTPAAQLISGGSVELASQTITQMTAEPTKLTWSVAASSFDYAKTTFDGYAVEEKNEDIFCLNGTTDPKCASSWTGATTAGEVAASGDFAPALLVSLIDVATNQVIQTTSATTSSPSMVVTLPGRAVGVAPHDYRVVLSAASMTQLRPPYLGTTFGDYTFLGLTYVGEPPQAAGVHCASFIQTQWGPECKSVAYHYRFTAVDQVKLHFSLDSWILQNGMNPGYLPTDFPSGSLAWDSGDDDLPGQY